MCWTQTPPHSAELARALARARVAVGLGVVGVLVVWCVLLCVHMPLMRAQNWRRNFLQAGGGLSTKVWTLSKNTGTVLCKTVPVWTMVLFGELREQRIVREGTQRRAESSL